MRFGDSPVTIDIMMSKPKEVPSSVRLTVLPHESVYAVDSFPPEQVKVETNVSSSAWRCGSATLRLRLFHISR
jgi:hypothetical protein